MLVYNNRCDPGQIKCFTGISHRQCQVCRLLIGHAIQQNRHCPGGSLVIRDGPINQSGNKEADLLFG